ncbi:MAG TPA: cupin domain-containing protein [Desulfonatronum sp.]|nr:cupin domain-containing protein [Desulfonatronum sp.]
MQGRLFKGSNIDFADHPRFAGVKIAVLVSGKDSDTVSVSVLEISPGVEIPVHTHDPQMDSIFVVSGHGDAYVNGAWQTVEAGDYVLAPKKAEHGMRNRGTGPLTLFIHHSPPLY